MSSLPWELFCTVKVIVTGLPAHANGGATGSRQIRLGLLRHIRLALLGPAETGAEPWQIVLKLPSARAEFGPLAQSFPARTRYTITLLSQGARSNALNAIVPVVPVAGPVTPPLTTRSNDTPAGRLAVTTLPATLVFPSSV